MQIVKKMIVVMYNNNYCPYKWLCRLYNKIYHSNKIVKKITTQVTNVC